MRLAPSVFTLHDVVWNDASARRISAGVRCGPTVRFGCSAAWGTRIRNAECQAQRELRRRGIELGEQLRVDRGGHRRPEYRIEAEGRFASGRVDSEVDL